MFLIPQCGKMWWGDQMISKIKYWMKKMWDKIIEKKIWEKIKNNSIFLGILFIVFSVIISDLLLQVVIPEGIKIINLSQYLNGKSLDANDLNNIIDNIFSAVKISLSILGALLVSDRYLEDRKNKVITENRIEWMYKIREYIVELNSVLNGYIISERLTNEEKIDMRIRIQNHIDKIILYLAPDVTCGNKTRNKLDIKLEKTLLNIGNAIKNNSDMEIVLESQKELLFIARVYFKVEWEKVKYEVKRNAQDLFETDKYYNKHYK